MAAQDAELKLKVSLDLAFFRAQLSRLPIEAAGYSVPIGIKLDNRSIVNEFRRLSKYLGQKKYRIDITDTAVSVAAYKVEKLSDKLKALSAKIQIDIGAGVSKDVGTAAKVMAQKLASQFQGDIGAAARAMQQMRPAAGPYGKGAMSVPGFKEAAQGMGIENAFKLFFQELKQVDPKRLAKVLDDGSTMMMRENADIKTGLDAIQNKAQKLASDLSAMGDAARISGRAFIKEGEKTLYPQNYGLKIASLLSSVEKLNNDLRRASVEGGVELLDALKDLSSTLRNASNSFVQIAGLNSTLDDTLRGFDTASKKASQATNAYADRINRRAGIGPAQLGVGTTTFGGSEVTGPLAKRAAPPDPYEVIEVQVREAFNIIEDFHKRRLDDFKRGYQAVIDNFYKSLTVQQVQIAGVSPFNIPPRQLALPAAGQTSAGQTRFNAVTTGGRRGGGGYVPPTGFPSDGPMGKQGEAVYMGAGSSMEKLKTSIAIAEQSMAKFRASSIPFIGGLREIGFEFATATKQVLLYGTAYRGLAFLTSLPGQFLNAAKAQQQFNNALQTATQDTGTFAKELLYVDNVQRAFGLNLETTRSGFVRLYASMAPTGFDSGSIEKLFTGISAATAALQLTPDKAERVIYAFGQMASKGQIMSEELKGQLGDVLPGALAIFAKSAGMSVKEFSKAMEDGEFVGQRFREVFAKVSDELMNRFGTGAQAAGKSLQGLLNTVQGDFQRTLESFAPLANAAAQAILLPLSGALKQLSMSAQIAMGEQERMQKQLISAQKDLSDLKIGGAKPEQIQAATQNVAALQARLEGLNMAAKDPAIAKQAKDLQAFVAEVTKAATVVMNIAKIIGSVFNPVITFLGTNLSTVVAVITGFTIALGSIRLAATAAMAALALMNVVIKGTTGQAIGVNALSVAFRALGINATAAQIGVIGLGRAFTVLMVSSGIGLAVGLFTAIAGAALSMGDAMRQAGEQARQTMRDMAQAAVQGNAALISMQQGSAQANIANLKELQAKILKRGKKVSTGRASAGTVYKATPQERMLAEASGAQLPSGTASEAAFKKAFNDALYVQKTVAQAAEQYKKTAQANAAKMGLNKPAPVVAGGALDEARKVGPKGAKPTPFVDKGVDILKNQYEERKKILDTQLAEQKISQYKYDLELSSLQLIRDEAILLKQREISREKIERSRMTAADKERSRLQAESVYFSGMQKAISAKTSRDAQALAKASKPITDGINEEKFALEKVTQEIKNYRSGLKGLTSAQEAEFLVRQKLLDMHPDDIAAIQDKIKAYQDLIQKRIEANKESEKEQALQGLRAQVGTAGQGLMAGFYGSAAQTFENALIQSNGNRGYAAQMAELETQSMRLQSVFGGIQNAIGGIGDAFGTLMTEGIASMIQGTATAEQVFADFLNSIGQALLQAAAQMIATYIAIGIARIFAGMGGGGGGKNVDLSGTMVTDMPVSQMPAGMQFAKGGIAVGGFKAFANGGVVQGPTLGLVGEGKYNEAIVPLPDGRSIPVQMQGDSIRDKMGGSSNSGGMASPVLSMNFETTTINNVEYVSREQLEQAMMETRRLATKDGARQGANLAIDKLQQSPNTRRRIGI